MKTFYQILKEKLTQHCESFNEFCSSVRNISNIKPIKYNNHMLVSELVRLISNANRPLHDNVINGIYLMATRDYEQQNR